MVRKKIAELEARLSDMETKLAGLEVKYVKILQELEYYKSNKVSSAVPNIIDKWLNGEKKS